MADSSALDVMTDVGSEQTVLGVDLPSGGGNGAQFAELGARIAARHRYLQVRPLGGCPDPRLPADTYIAAWVADIQRDERPVLAVLGHGVGSVYAGEIAECISGWQDPPQVILLDPQVPSMKLLGGELHRDISALSSLLSDDEIECARKMAVEVSETEVPDIAVAAAEIVENYLEAITAAFERAGLGGARGNKLTTHLEWYVSWLSAANQLDPGRAWRRSTALVSSDHSGFHDLIGRRIPFDVSQTDLLRSDSVASTILDLLDCKT